VEARWPVVHQQHVAATVDSNGYTVPATWGASVDRFAYSWEPELVDVKVDVAYQMRVTDRQAVMVPDVNEYSPGDRVALNTTAADVDADTVWRRVDQIRDYSHDPFGIAAFGPAPGVIVLEAVSG
jgi:hypothetical protein